MKRKLSLGVVMIVAIGLSVGAFTADAATKDDNDYTGDWYLVVLNSDFRHILSSGLSTDISGNPTYALKQDGEQIIGTGNSKVGKLIIKGIVKRNGFEMEGTVGQIPIRFEGSLEEGKIMGKIIIGFEEADFMMKRI